MHNTRETPERLLSLRAAARQLGINERYLYRARDAGELDHYLIANRGYLRLGEARKWLEAHRRPGRGDR